MESTNFLIFCLHFLVLRQRGARIAPPTQTVSAYTTRHALRTTTTSCGVCAATSERPTTASARPRRRDCVISAEAPTTAKTSWFAARTTAPERPWALSQRTTANGSCCVCAMKRAATWRTSSRIIATVISWRLSIPVVFKLISWLAVK